MKKLQGYRLTSDVDNPVYTSWFKTGVSAIMTFPSGMFWVCQGMNSKHVPEGALDELKVFDSSNRNIYTLFGPISGSHYLWPLIRNSKPDDPETLEELLLQYQLPVLSGITVLKYFMDEHAWKLSEVELIVRKISKNQNSGEVPDGTPAQQQ